LYVNCFINPSKEKGDSSLITIDSDQVCFLELIKASLFNICPSIPENVNWNNVYDFAKTQCVLSLVASSVPFEHRNEWIIGSYQCKAYYMRMLYEQDMLVRLFNSKNIPLVIFKGTAASLYYPNPTLRTFGDIDFYVSEINWDLACNLLKENGYKFITSDVRHQEFQKNEMTFELHSKISSKHYNDVESIFCNGLKNAVEYKIGNYSFPGLPPYENGLVLLGHIMQHLKSSGIGLRQIIDWMMFVHKELNDSAWEDSFRPYAVEAGLEKLAVIVTYMCKKWLGLSDSITWCDNADEEVADQLLIWILDDGNLGQYRAPVENVKKSMREEGIFKYLQRAGLENWLLPQKYIVFKPFAWIFQLCKYIHMVFASLFTGKKMFMKGKHKMSLEELWERLE